MANSPATKYFATGIAAVVLTFGAYLVGRSNTTATTAAGSAQVSPGSGAPSGRAPQAGPLAQGGQAPPGFGTPVTGATASKLAALVTAKYPGQVERAMRLDDGSYVVHVITAGGERHVAVSRAFRITGTQEGGPGRGQPQPPGGSGATSGSRS